MAVRVEDVSMRRYCNVATTKVASYTTLIVWQRNDMI